jgi:hypothetical protein
MRRTFLTLPRTLVRDCDSARAKFSHCQIITRSHDSRVTQSDRKCHLRFSLSATEIQTDGLGGCFTTNCTKTARIRGRRSSRLSGAPNLSEQAAMMNTVQRWMKTCLVSAFLIGCGGGGTEEQSAPAATGTAGTPGASAAGRPGGGAAGAGIPGVMMSSVMCGTATCTGFMAMGFGAAACCADPATNACGTMMGATCMAKPAVAENCPKIAPIFGMQVNSCCQADMTCGVDGSALGRGCQPYMSLAMLPGAMVPPATKCDGTPIPGGATGAAGGGAAAAGSSAGAAGSGVAAAAGSSAAGSSAAGGAGRAAAGTGATAAGSGAAAGSSASGTAGRGAAGSSSTSTGSAGSAGAP